LISIIISRQPTSEIAIILNIMTKSANAAYGARSKAFLHPLVLYIPQASKVRSTDGHGRRLELSLQNVQSTQNPAFDVGWGSSGSLQPCRKTTAVLSNATAQTTPRASRFSVALLHSPHYPGRSSTVLAEGGIPAGPLLGRDCTIAKSFSTTGWHLLGSHVMTRRFDLGHVVIDFLFGNLSVIDGWQQRLCPTPFSVSNV
jgi:hypothetical protein